MAAKIEADPRVDDAVAAACRYAGAQLPLISFIVINYNYGRFLRQCVESIFAQTYPIVECIVVDNKSTDDSLKVIADLKSIYPQLDVICEPENKGQNAACIDGYRISRGHFVVFVDADDYLFETFAETHFLVHLSLRHAVGFTSSDMTQIVDGSIVLSTIFEAAGSIDPQNFRKVEPDASRSLPEARGGGAKLRPVVEVEKLSLRFVLPTVVDWVWSPTSGTMYRRNALALFVDCVTLPSLRRATDAFFNYAINAFTGSVLIDKPLSAYCIHGDNLFTRQASLNNLLCFAFETDDAPRAAGLALRHVVANIHEFVAISRSPGELLRAMRTLARVAGRRRSRSAMALKLRAFTMELMRLYGLIKIKMS
jgi:glycosyltransferase involved in cell wall biosynthesis